MNSEISYGAAVQIGAATPATTYSDGTEHTLVTITDLKYHKKSQMTTYFDISLVSGSTKVSVRYYMSPDNGTTWFQVPLKITSTGILSNIPTVLDLTSPTQTTKIRTIEDISLSGTTAVKITGQADNAAGFTVNTLNVFGRDN